VTPEAILFWILAILTGVSALTVVLITNPIYSALSLAMTMVGVSALFVTLNAYFLAGVQLIVYAGAVMVLFVMVLMLFDLKHELHSFTHGKFTGAIKLACVGMLGGLIVGSVLMTSYNLLSIPTQEAAAGLAGDNTKALGRLLFSQYLFGFEALGVLLLIVAVGAVALSRSKGGTHAKH
jgi:NADH-quinone oxidoreductase subunit J